MRRRDELWCPPPRTACAVPPPPPPRVSPLGPKAVWWIDVAGCAARRRLRETLGGQSVELGLAERVLLSTAAPFQTRNERAHRRQTWTQRDECNQRSPDAGGRLRVHGVPTALERLLGIPRDLPHAA